MATYREERNARQDYICACCGMVIPAGTQYVRITQHNITLVPVKHSKKLYHGRVYYRKQHSNVVKTYHIECVE